MLTIDCRFPGGNIKVHDIQGDTVFVSPDLRDTRTSWFYWAFRVRGAAGRTLVFRFLSDHPVGTRGPAISTDGRRTWRWTDEAFDQDAFRATIPADETYLCFAPLYTQENWERFLADEAAFAKNANNGFAPGFFAKSRKGRPVEILHAGAPAEKAAKHVVFTARHHCCEMIADWTMEGIAATVLDGAGADSAWLRENVSFSFVPFVDKDGVEDGDQGKNRAPHDHNRDYGDNAIYPETAAVRGLVGAIAKRYGKVDVFIDLHCPWIRGAGNENVYQVGSKYPAHAERQTLFGDLVEAAIAPDALPYFRADNYPYGVGWNVAGNEADGISSTKWAGRNPAVGFVTSFEIPYANAREVNVTPDRARGLGRAIATALAQFLRDGAGDGR
jgi:hypothetical protein